MTSSPQKRSGLSPAAAFSSDDDEQYLPWKIAFRVQFQSEKLGLRFHPAQYPDTGNGLYTIRLLELTKGPNGDGPAQHYNASLQPGQEHLTLRPGLYLTHINGMHLVEVPCQEIIQSLQSIPRPVTLRFVDVEAGVVTRHELRDSLRLDGDALSTAIAAMPGSSPPSPRRRSSSSSMAHATEPEVSATYKVILLGTTGVGKSSLLAVAANGDNAYMERRATTLEAEFGSLDFADPKDPSGTARIKARVWDTAGQERYRAITRSHYRRADGALLVYDVSDAESFERLGEWLHTLRETAGDSLTCSMVVENKVDRLETAEASRPAEFAQEDTVRAFCEAQGLLFARTTAKCNARAADWDGAMPAADAVKRLVLKIHATRTGSEGSAPPSPARASEKSDRVVLTDAPKGGISTMAGDCGGCAGS